MFLLLQKLVGIYYKPMGLHNYPLAMLSLMREEDLECVRVTVDDDWLPDSRLLSTSARN